MSLAGVLSLAAAAIHFGYAPGHFDVKASHGWFFLAVGAFQAGWAALAFVWPRVRGVRLLALGHLAVAGVWLASRTVGVDGDAESVGFPDGLATGMAMAVAALVLAAVASERRAAGADAGGGAVARRAPAIGVAALSAVVAGATLLALSPRYVDAHEHDADNPGHVEHLAAAHTDLPTTAGTPTGTTPCELSGPPASPAQITDGHDHRGPIGQKPVDQATRVALAKQQEAARTVAVKFPTVAAATAAGYRKSTPYIPCIGAHYTNIMLVVGFDPARPSELLFDGTGPESKLVGLSYLVYHPGGAPEGFAGPNDVWHQHNSNGGLCFDRSGLVIAGEESTDAECGALGGRKRELTDVWMLHDWVVPGWECSWGVFAPECPELGGKTGLTAWD